MSWYPDLLHVQAAGDGGPRSRTQVVVIHATDNTAPASNEAEYASYRDDQTSAHFFADGTQVIQCLDTTHIAYGCLWHGNQISVQFELCGRSNQVSDATMRESAPIVARVCAEFGIPIRKLTPDQVAAGERGICGHADITAAFPQDGGDHTDPGTAFSWATFISYVAGGDTDMPLKDDIDGWALCNRVEDMLQLHDKVTASAAKGEALPLVGLLKQLAADLADLKARPPATVTLSDTDRADIAARIAAALGHPVTAEQLAAAERAAADRLAPPAAGG